MRPAAALVLLLLGSPAPELKFRHHAISNDLPATPQGNGGYALTALVDLDKDGDLDYVTGGRPAKPSQLFWFEFQGPAQWVRHAVGADYQAHVGLAPLDVDGDGWTDLVCSGVWYRNPGKPKEGPFERIRFAENAAGAHDIVAADVDDDGRKDLIMMGDERTAMNALCWFRIPADPRTPWERRAIGPPIHGGISPAGADDLDGDGDVDVVCGDVWYENRDKGREWVPHDVLPLRTGPYGKCVRAAIVDMDGDGRKEVVMADADRVDSHVAILRNADGKGGRWEKVELPQSFKYGSLHSLAVADLNGDGRPDVVVNEQEELLPDGRQDPRWIAWINEGGGKYVERIILDAKLGGHELQAGDVDGDGDIDLCSKPWHARPWNGAGGRLHADFLENLLRSKKE